MATRKNSRGSFTPEQRTALVDAYKQSGQSLAVFAKENGVTGNTLSVWSRAVDAKRAAEDVAHAAADIVEVELAPPGVKKLTAAARRQLAMAPAANGAAPFSGESLLRRQIDTERQKHQSVEASLRAEIQGLAMENTDLRTAIKRIAGSL